MNVEFAILFLLYFKLKEIEKLSKPQSIQKRSNQSAEQMIRTDRTHQNEKWKKAKAKTLCSEPNGESVRMRTKGEPKAINLGSLTTCYRKRTKK